MFQDDLNALRLFLIDELVPAILDDAQRRSGLMDVPGTGNPTDTLNADRETVHRLMAAVDKYEYEFRELNDEVMALPESVLDVPPHIWDAVRLKAPSAQKLNVQLITACVIRALNMKNITHCEDFFK